MLTSRRPSYLNWHNCSIALSIPQIPTDAARRIRRVQAITIRAGEASLMVGVEFHTEGNEVVGKIYDAKSVLKHATEPSRDAHLDGSVRATVSRLLRELAAKVAGDPSF